MEFNRMFSLTKTSTGSCSVKSTFVVVASGAIIRIQKFNRGTVFSVVSKQLLFLKIDYYSPLLSNFQWLKQLKITIDDLLLGMQNAMK